MGQPKWGGGGGDYQLLNDVRGGGERHCCDVLKKKEINGELW